ncbi:hypothetical protein A4U53_039375 (plasmid) [Rhizobium ruizarguesonis]|uniref:Uncharacterized protein n=1 Tax=Rhizobium ruizarguesonis TaxID=2081791 RepID=A0ACD5EWU3_9HYPH
MTTAGSTDAIFAHHARPEPGALSSGEGLIAKSLSRPARSAAFKSRLTIVDAGSYGATSAPFQANRAEEEGNGEVA